MYQSADEFLEDFLAHRAPYDPIKAHAYYIRTRKLKGRKGGQAQPATSGGNNGQSALTVEAAVKGKASTQARVEAIRARLDRLKQVLSQLLKDAEAGKTSDTSKKSSSSTDSSKTKPETATEKAKRKVRDHQRNVRVKNDTPKTPAEAKAARIAAVREQIRQAEAQLREALRQARAQQTSSGAPSGVQTPGTHPTNQH